MYKKPFSVQAQNLLSKKDVKNLKTQLTEQYPGLNEKALTELLPDGQVKLLKLDSRALLYAVGEQAPVFFDLDGRGELFPTMTTLWQFPQMMPELTIHPEVSKFVLNGADLMLPGVIVPEGGVAAFGEVEKGQKRCIKIEGNPYPIAVGKMLVSQSEMKKLKGKGLEVMHVYKDALWAFAGKPVPNAGFSEKEDEVTRCEDASWVPGSAPAAATPATASTAAPDEAPAAAPAAAPSTEAAPEAAAAAPAAAESGGAAAGAPRAAADWTQDELLDFCFLQAFKVSLTDDKSIPIEVSPTEFRSQMNELGRCLRSLDGITLPELLGHFMRGALSEDDLKELMPYADKNIGTGTEDADCFQLFAHVDRNKDGVVTLKELATELLELQGCMEAAGGLTIKELSTLLHRAFKQFDSNQDGQVSAEEFVQAVHRLGISMDEKQALRIHSYLDADKSGAIDSGEWSSTGGIPSWIDALKAALVSQVQRKGFNKLGYIAEVAHGIAEGPGDLVAKGRLLFARLWDGSDELVDVANVFNDSVGVCAALSGIWQEVSGINSLAEINDMDLLPFLVFLGISSVKMVRHLAEGQVSDLSEREALLYATVFQKEGFSVTEFRRLLGYGDLRWDVLAAGETVERGAAEGEAAKLHVVARGGCRLGDASGQRIATVHAGGFLGSMLGEDGEPCLSDKLAWATEATTLLTWDSEKLKSQLQHDENLKRKVARAVTISLADRLLSAKEHSPTARAAGG